MKHVSKLLNHISEQQSHNGANVNIYLFNRICYKGIIEDSDQQHIHLKNEDFGSALINNNTICHIEIDDVQTIKSVTGFVTENKQYYSSDYISNTGFLDFIRSYKNLDVFFFNGVSLRQMKVIAARKHLLICIGNYSIHIINTNLVSSMKNAIRTLQYD